MRICNSDCSKDFAIAEMREEYLSLVQQSKEEERKRIAKLINPSEIKASNPNKYADVIIEVYHSLSNPPKT